MRYGLLLVVVLTLAVALGVFACQSNTAANNAVATTCLASGGLVATGQCCLATGDFPNSCAIGACGCSSPNSHSVTTCACPAGHCFDGARCVPSTN